jgi:hypothetical protein
MLRYNPGLNISTIGKIVTSFKGRHHQQGVILQCARWYVAYSLSNRDLEELMQERGNGKPSLINIDKSDANTAGMGTALRVGPDRVIVSRNYCCLEFVKARDRTVPFYMR